MSDHFGSPPPSEWSPAAGLVVIAWIGAVGAAAWFLVLLGSGADPAGQVLAAVATVGLAVAALFGTRARPRLRIDGDGLTVTGLRGRRHLPWQAVGAVRVHKIRRWGRESPLLEVNALAPDGTEQLLLFGRLDLNADPVDVAEAVNARRP